MSDEHLGIVELAEICTRMRTVNLELFEELGGWVTATEGGAPQRHFATACHRHAWHAELWERRTPSIPGASVDTTIAVPATRHLPARSDSTGYQSVLDELLVELDELASRVDAELDPATHRVLALVRSDLTELRDR